MPKKETRESIETELAATEVERAIARCREVLRDVQDLEMRLQKQELEWGITPLPDKPLIERMAAVGMSKDVIQQVSDMLKAITRIVSSKTNEVPEGARISLGAMADAEISANSCRRFSMRGAALAMAAEDGVPIALVWPTLEAFWPAKQLGVRAHL